MAWRPLAISGTKSIETYERAREGRSTAPTKMEMIRPLPSCGAATSGMGSATDEDCTIRAGARSSTNRNRE